MANDLFLPSADAQKDQMLDHAAVRNIISESFRAKRPTHLSYHRRVQAAVIGPCEIYATSSLAPELVLCLVTCVAIVFRPQVTWTEV